jgi:hypothetical protein
MRHLPLLAAVCGLTACAGGTAPPAASAEAGPALTIRNDGHRLLDLSYRCVQNGAVYRLDAVEPLTVRTFRIRPAWCANLHFVSHVAASRDPESRAFAVVPLHDDRPNLIVFNAYGMLENRTGRGGN